MHAAQRDASDDQRERAEQEGDVRRVTTGNTGRRKDAPMTSRPMPVTDLTASIQRPLRGSATANVAMTQKRMPMPIA